MSGAFGGGVDLAAAAAAVVDLAGGFFTAVREEGIEVDEDQTVHPGGTGSSRRREGGRRLRKPKRLLIYRRYASC